MRPGAKDLGSQSQSVVSFILCVGRGVSPGAFELGHFAKPPHGPDAQTDEGLLCFSLSPP